MVPEYARVFRYRLRFFFASTAFVCIGLGEKFANSRLRFSFVLQVVLLADL